MGSKVSKPKSKKDKECLIQTCYDPKIEGGISSMEVSDDGSVIACGYDSGEIRLWSAKTAEVGCISQLEGHEDYITCLIMEEHILYSSSADGDIRKWDMQTSQCLLIFRPPAENGECRSTIIKIVSVGEFLFSASYDKTARCWDTENGELVKTFKGHKNSLSSLLFIPCEKENLNEAIQFVAQAAQEKNMTNPIDPAAKVVESLTQQHGKVDDECNVYSRDLIITGSMDRTARAWSIETGETVQIFRGHTNCVTCLAVDPLGKMLFTGSSDHTIRSWEIMTGQQLKVFTGHQTTVLYLLAHRKLLFSASSDNTVRCWVMEFGDCTRVYKGHTHSISYIMEHEGLVYTACGDGHARCYDAKSGALKRIFKGHALSITFLRVVDKRLFTGSVDGTLKVWDISDLSAEKAGKNGEKGEEEEEEQEEQEEEQDE